MQETNQTTKRTKSYTCELCQKVFTQKIDYTRHTKKKNACVSLEQLQEIVQTEQVIRQNINDEKTILINIFKTCLNILRDNEGLTGEKALRTLSHLLTWKLLEQHFGKEINIDDYEYKFDEYFEDEVLEHNKNRLLSCVRFSNLINEDENNLPNMMKYIWDIILSEHPSTKNIFLKGDGFKIVRQISYKKLLDKLNELPTTNNDILGDVYEEVTKDIMKGKILGQFFTPHSVKSLMIKLINPQINENGTIETFCDPTMGTAGFLVSYLKNILGKSVEKNIQLDWDFIKTQGIYGKEIEPDTYQLATSNMLISSGHVFEHLERGDSIRNPIMRKFDNILANPPFGIKGLKYNDFHLDEDVRNSYIPIKTDNAVSLFIQAIICMLNINGKCAIVLPDGQDLFSKSNKTLIAIREYLMKTCDLQEIIYLPSGIFEYTSIKTCIFYFIKKVEGNEVMEIKFKKNKNIETRTNYKFSNIQQTISVKFYDYNPYEDIKNLLVDVPIEQIANNSYSLNYTEYLKSDENNEEDNLQNEIIVKTLDEIFGPKINNFIELVDDVEYNVVGLSSNGYSKISKKINSFEIKIKRQQICKLGQFCISKILNGCYGIINENTDGGIISSEYWLFNINLNIINKKYLNYIFKNQIYNKLKIISNGVGIPRINYEKFKILTISIPSLERQKEIVQYLDFIYEKANKTSEEKIKELKQLNEYCLNNEIKFENNNVKTLEEVCEINYGTRIVRKNNTEGEYPVYGSGRATFTTNNYNREGYNILIGRFALSCECVRFINEKIFLNDSGLSIKPKVDNLLHKYLGYYLLNNQQEIYNCSRGSAQKNLEIDLFKIIEIPIPSLKKQRQIIEYCDRNCKLIKQLENEIENNKRIAKQFLNDILTSSTDLYESEIIEEDESHLKTCGLEEEINIENEEDDETEYDCEFED